MCLDFKGIDFGGGIKSESLPLMASRTVEEDLTASLESSSGISARGKSSDTGPSVADGVIPPANRRSSGVAVFLRAFKANANNRWTFDHYQNFLAYNKTNFITKNQSHQVKNLNMKNAQLLKHYEVLNAD